MTSNEPESPEQLVVCPSFNSYSANRLADVALAVALEDEDKDEGRGGYGFGSEPTSSGSHRSGRSGGGDYDEARDDDFEFVPLVREHDEVLINGGQIGPVFPVFNRDLLYVHGDRTSDGEAKEDREIPLEDLFAGDRDRDRAVSSIRIPLKDLFVGDRDPPSSSSSSSEADELEGIPEGSYCVWTPKPPAGSPSGCKKSSSTGSCSKRWRFRDLLRRSNSDGKDSFVFLTPSSRSSSMSSRSSDAKAGGGEAKEKASPPTDQAVAVAVAERRSKVKASSASAAAAAAAASAHEVFYVRNRALKEGGKRRSYLPYRRDLVGFFANVNGLGRTFPPF
ncbi:uncharacterized protein LOC115688225 [Syzygium oleosum]|uniref:uncharacterized protein LOC115688225 n=1 Tax=Syzygium oleosum TaxID=219896 RepID=UPI0024B8F9C3|nr:uncharacterized protein LOC115688225 [Syzygium oleosum]